MRNTWHLWLGAAALLSGCARPSLYSSPGASSPFAGIALPSTSAPSNAATGGAASSLSADAIPVDPYGKLPAQVSAPATTTGGVVLASLWQAGKSVSNALKIQEKVHPANDPVKLDNQPANTAQVAADLHYHAGYFFETQHRPIEAAAHYRDVLQTSPEDVRALAGFGRVQDQLGNTVEANNYLKKACELAPQDAAPFNDLAQFHARQSNLDAAIQCQRQAVSLNPSNQLYRGNLARFLVDAGQNDEAVQQLAAAHGEASAHFQVSCLLHERHQTDLARQHLQRSLALNPSLAPARQMWNRWQVAAAQWSPEQDPQANLLRLPAP